MRAKQPPPENAVLPHWAVRFSSSVTALGDRETSFERGEGYKSAPLANGSTLLQGLGVSVVALRDNLNGHDVRIALDELRRAGGHDSDIQALAFPPELGTAPPDYVSYMADRGIAIVRDQGQDSLARATAYMLRVLGLRKDALEHLRPCVTRRHAPLPSRGERGPR